ncbi:MAG: hypothetical protein MUF64_10495 [Polyangiaceae bacterium]|jgi:hypothetical protein|nr:hypothetical protein [Polyangiaceae bacterium]
MTPLLLSLLALADVTFSAFRDAAGRNPRIEKERYYRRAMAGGFACGLGALGVCWGALRGLLALVNDPEVLYRDMAGAGGWMLGLYGSYATVVLGALGVWLLGGSELRTLMSVSILGPLTLLRHGLIPVGLALAWWQADRWETRGLALLGVMLVGSAEQAYGAIRARRRGRLWPGEPEDMASP